MEESLQSQAEFQDQELHRERCSKYRGTARVRISNLRYYTDQVEKTLYEGPEIVKNLKKVQELEAAAARSNTTLDGLLEDANEPPELKFPASNPLPYLHGIQRLRAAAECLPPGDDLWPVDLYLQDSSQKFRDLLREEYSNSANFSDREIFRHIHFYTKEQDEFARRKWWARLTKDKADYLRRIMRRKELYKAFVGLLNITGLWPAFQIGPMHRYLILKCDEELIHGLRHVCSVWSTIAGGDLAVMQMTDATTVRTLELRAPGTFAFDGNFINSKMEAGELFGSISDASLRMKIKVNVLSVYPVIPTLFTFCENTKYLEAPQNIMRGFLPPKFKGSIYSAMRRAYTGTNGEKGSLMIKDDENTFIPIRVEGMDGFECGYWQLWVRALRDFPDMTNIPPRKERDRQKPIIKEPGPTRWHEFAKMAYKLGFDSEQIQRYIKSDPMKETIRSCWRNPTISAAILAVFLRSTSLPF